MRMRALVAGRRRVKYMALVCVVSVIYDSFYSCSHTHRNVQCYDTVEGAQCGQCPVGYDGDGRQCQPKSGCHTNPCATGMMVPMLAVKQQP